MTDPWNEPAHSIGTRESGRGDNFDSGYRHQQDSVSGTLRISDMVAPRKIPPGSGWRRFIYNALIQVDQSGWSRLRSGIIGNYAIGYDATSESSM